MAMMDAFEWLKNPEHFITGGGREINIEWLKDYNVKEILVKVDPDKDGYYEVGDFAIRLPEERTNLVSMFIDLGEGPYKEISRDEDDPELIWVHTW